MPAVADTKELTPNEIAKRERRMMMFHIGQEYMLGLVTGKLRITNIPEGADLHSVHYDYQTLSFCIIAIHPSFEQVWQGRELPTLMLEVE